MANISEFHGIITVPERAFDLENFSQVWSKLAGMQVRPSAIDSSLNIEKDYVKFRDSRIYKISGGAAWTFDDSASFLFAQFSPEYERDALYQKMLVELAESDLSLQYEIAEYEPGCEILDEERGKLQVVDGHLEAEIIELFQYNCLPEKILELGFKM